jgi:long-chain acyl-CoA synthetase
MSRLSSRVIAAVAFHADRTPRAIAIEGESRTLDYATLVAEVIALADSLRTAGCRVAGLLADNGPDWAIADLACLAADIPLVPLPTFFSPAQLEHVIRQAGIDLILTDRPQALAALGADSRPLSCPGTLTALRLCTTATTLPAGTAKITFTSGTTGTPKGVCLSLEGMETVAESLQKASAAHPGDRHLSLLPLSTLLENIAGLYVPLLAGASTRLLPGESVGLAGSSGVDPARMLAALATARASSAILVPQLLLALLAALRAGAPRPAHLRYVAVGGAPVSLRLLADAARLGLPVFEGYGLSECGSVVAVNRPGDTRIGSVGRPLEHLAVAIGDKGAIRVRGAAFLGYLGEVPHADVWVDTGDLGYLDDDGRLHLTGRQKNMFITAFGRNVAPEWVERELLLQSPIAQAAVFGEGRSFNMAVIVARGSASDEAIDAAITTANLDLPDYARIGAWIRASAPFTAGNAQLTANGRPRRDAIGAAYADAIDQTYPTELAKEDHGLLC